MHRFWKLLIWKSHHQALLLGTRTDDFCSPSVQKFDHILSFSLPMLNGYNKLVNTKHTRTNNGIANSHNSNVNLSLYDHLPYSNSSTIEHTTPYTVTQGYSLDDSGIPSLTSTATSQFENYSRYITVPLEMESTSSIFPPYAMVLGKDALEIFGKTLSDFEFITADGDSIGVPVYLLRKDGEDILIHFSKTTKFGNSSQSSNGSLEKYFSKNGNSKSNSNTSLKKPHSVDFTSSTSSPKQRAISHNKLSPPEPILCADEEDSRSNTLKQHATGDTGLKETGTSNKKADIHHLLFYSSLAEYVQFGRDSPVASRRSSHSTRKSSSSDARRISNSSLLRNTLDSQLLSNSYGSDIPYEASIQEYGMNNGRDEEEDGDNQDYGCISPSNIRPIFSTINAININGNFKEGDFFSSKSYINNEKSRRLSYISNPESVEYKFEQ
ncbi:BEM_collapsed_G0016660.mRNA.1.CDS.1 [Saccharomyces cerevisiae]|nr:BEM_collapsed_G0016660.mRNA.1.CDS.1 [Saccharomyces cerevisiae]